jgi:hypothetical protein
MNMFRAFMELDKLQESVESEDVYDDFGDRQELITKIKSLGRHYYFNKYSYPQLRAIWRKESAKEAARRAERELFNSYKDELIDVPEYEYCENCGRELNPLGECPTCDLGDNSTYDDLDEAIQYCWFGAYLDKNKNKKVIYATKDSTSYDADEAADILENSIPEPYTKFIFRGSIDSTLAEKEGYKLIEGTFDGKPAKLTGWKVASGPLNTQTANQVQSPPQSVSIPQTATSNVVTIVYDDKAHKLRARADDGVHGEANVAFPNNLRNKEGQQYEVEKLIWNGKNYRASGNIEAI